MHYYNKVPCQLQETIPLHVICDLLRPPVRWLAFDSCYSTNTYTLHWYTLKRGTSIRIVPGQPKTSIHLGQIVTHLAEDCLSASKQQRAVRDQYNACALASFQGQHTRNRLHHSIETRHSKKQANTITGLHSEATNKRTEKKEVTVPLAIEEGVLHGSILAEKVAGNTTGELITPTSYPQEKSKHLY